VKKATGRTADISTRLPSTRQNTVDPVAVFASVTGNPRGSGWSAVAVKMACSSRSAHEYSKTGLFSSVRAHHARENDRN
jgi:hypothetical protein